MSGRLEKLDILRGIAIILMVLFHFNYSLIHLYDNELMNFSESIWFVIGRISALLFIIISGISFALAVEKYKKKIYKKYIKVSLLLGIIALLISGFTYIYIPTKFIVFGILHFFSLSFLLLLILHKLKYVNIFIGFIIIYLGYFLDFQFSNSIFSFIGWPAKDFNSADYYPLFPYFGFLLIGYVFGEYLLHKKKLHILKGKYENRVVNSISIAGKNSLLIYIFHQPVIVIFIYLLNKTLH